MNKINKEELFAQLSSFLRAKGIDLHAGSYTQVIEKGCQVLADTINLSQQALERAKSEIEQQLERARQAVHEKTAPKPPPVASAPAGESKGEERPRRRRRVGTPKAEKDHAKGKKSRRP